IPDTLKIETIGRQNRIFQFADFFDFQIDPGSSCRFYPQAHVIERIAVQVSILHRLNTDYLERIEVLVNGDPHQSLLLQPGCKLLEKMLIERCKSDLWVEFIEILFEGPVLLERIERLAPYRLDILGYILIEDIGIYFLVKESGEALH